MPRERRVAERLDILDELRGEVMVYQAVTITQISVRGAQIETPFPLQIDSLHEFRLSLAEGSIVVRGRVIHCQVATVDGHQVRYRMGVEFIEPSVRVREAIVEFVEALALDRKQATRH